MKPANELTIAAQHLFERTKFRVGMTELEGTEWLSNQLNLPKEECVIESFKYKLCYQTLKKCMDVLEGRDVG